MPPSRLVLVLNQNYEPLNVCHVHRALILLDKGKAETLENGNGYLRTVRIVIPLPSVIRLVYMVRRPLPKRKLTRREIFLRDRFACQYCGKEGRDLTIDHVTPRYRGGQHTWDNVVAACVQCNHHKANHTPAEAGMRLRVQPKAPPLGPYHLFSNHLASRQEWRKFIPFV
ncbi:MAG: HNH endonuclease [Dehalococcoidia bacterium]|nr:HNH endonuclease [Dehalococcoidia bacterium]